MYAKELCTYSCLYIYIYINIYKANPNIWFILMKAWNEIIFKNID